MRISHGCYLIYRIAKTMLHCDISMVSWEESTTGTKAMNAAFRSTHSGFETLRKMSRTPAQSAYRRFQIATNEQLTARGYANPQKPLGLYSDFIQR
jgi:hypothetical protein